MKAKVHVIRELIGNRDAKALIDMTGMACLELTTESGLVFEIKLVDDGIRIHADRPMAISPRSAVSIYIK